MAVFGWQKTKHEIVPVTSTRMASSGSDTREKPGEPKWEPSKGVGISVQKWPSEPRKKNTEPRHAQQLKKTQMCKFFASGRQGGFDDGALGLGFAGDLS